MGQVVRNLMPNHLKWMLKQLFPPVWSPFAIFGRPKKYRTMGMSRFDIETGSQGQEMPTLLSKKARPTQGDPQSPPPPPPRLCTRDHS